MKNETARREIESLDYYLQNHTDDYSEESHTAMMMAVDALLLAESNIGYWEYIRCDMYECSECQHIYTDLSGEKQGMNFCPNCGARMIER